LLLNVGKCKTITFARSRHPVEFTYMLDGTVLDRVNSINDFGVIMDEKMTFSGHVDVMVAKTVARMLGFIRRLLLEFRDSYTLKSLHTSLVRPKLEYAGLVWKPFYDGRVDRVERVQRRFIRYALLGLGWTFTLKYIFDVLSGRVNSPKLLSI
jgi:hypothetical protein